jgi:CheY-like chemotaxis protein
MARTILLADDSVTIQKVVELTFLDEDIRVVSCGNGADAIARLEEIRPDAVLADVHMPGADGYEVAAAVGRSLHGVPVMLLVGTFEVFDAQRAAESGAIGHMKKPFDSQELLRRVKELLAGSGGSAPAWSAPPAAPRESVLPAPPEMASTPEFEAAAEPAAPLSESSWSFEPIVEAPSVAPDTWGGADAGSFEPVPDPEPVVERHAESAEAAAPGAGMAPSRVPFASGDLSDADVDRIARRVVELLGEKIVRDVAWDVVPDLAEVLLKARIRELEASVE